MLYAEGLSYAQAEQRMLSESYVSQASQVLEQASELQSQAIKGLGLPKIDLNLRSYALHSEFDVPLDALKSGLENSLINGANSKIDEWQGDIPGLSASDVDQLKGTVGQGIKDGVGLIPNSTELTIKDHVTRPTVSVMMPIYTGGLISSAKEIARIKAQSSQISAKQQQDLQKFEIIKSYFSVQLQKNLLHAGQFNVQAMQKHYNNALKFEREGLISKGQRMQFEVARNNAERLLTNTQTMYQSNLFQLNNLLQTSQITELTTPLFINSSQSQDLNRLLKTFAEHSNLIRKMQVDTQLADVNIKAQQAAKKPTVFAFGEYALEKKENWIVGIAASYNLFSGINKNKNIQAAELQKQASELLTSRTKQEIETIIYTAYNEMNNALITQQLLQSNMQAAQENLRIQELSFKEDMGSATQVIDAQNAMSAIRSEMALNAYKYVMSLATLLQSYGSIDQFQSYIHQPNTRYIQ
ncbi:MULTISPECIES: TolC family protein [unclassified Acinetobacter]|uniref:TolC family protein n=1 Tax=unclassified Acinetobacter TaxID=196816 RepID=UPI002934C81C|nr:MULTISPECIES: TolC family protein [unclassified Acinetobacter]WOE31557.1 TolC family protein [Acinetobacter sp. SAAs470]WOE39754.1 TolC family protein [Acinetobacter sp. SAAs474]